MKKGLMLQVAVVFFGETRYHNNPNTSGNTRNLHGSWWFQ